MFRRVVVALVVLVALAAVFLVVAPRFREQRDQTTGRGATDSRSADTAQGGDALPRTSEELIAAALKAGDLTYEESLLARAYALYDDRRLEPAFRSPIIDWEASTALLDEIDRKAATLSASALEALAPFRARPNDPISIVNRPRADVVKAQLSAQPTWESELVASANIRVWLLGSKETLRQKYLPLVIRVASVFQDFFPYPIPDDGKATDQVNPDAAIDVYLLDASTLDPRWAPCRAAPYPTCTLGTVLGSSPSAEPKGTRTSSGYVRVNLAQTDDAILDTIAHELAHATQRKYDSDEWEVLGNAWLAESSATWVSYKVMKQLGKVPQFEYDRLEELRPVPGARSSFLPIFKTLHQQLDLEKRPYSGWLFFYHASMELGDRIVTRVWEAAAKPGVDGMDAVDQAIPLDLYFPRFTVRNWNRDPVVKKYGDVDQTFPPQLKPEPVVNFAFAGPGTEELAEPVDNLAARYYRVTFIGSVVHRLTFQNLFTDLKDAHVWAIPKIGTAWMEPEDWSREQQKTFCLDSARENLTELVIVVSNSHISTPLPSAHPRPRLLAEDVGCSYIEGSARSTLRVKDGAQDLTYVGTAKLRFRPRTNQSVGPQPDGTVGTTPGVVEYDLMPTSVKWTVSGRKGDCRVTGEVVVEIPDLHDQPLRDIILRPAWGYLHLTGQDGGDWHGPRVTALSTEPGMVVTCPGSPPSVGHERFESALLLHVLSQPNTHDGNVVAYKGTKVYDLERADSLPAMARGMIANIPGVADALKNLPAGGRRVYTFEWDLRPLGPQAAPPPRP